MIATQVIILYDDTNQDYMSYRVLDKDGCLIYSNVTDKVMSYTLITVCCDQGIGMRKLCNGALYCLINT